MADNKLLDVEIVTPHKVVYQGKAVSVTVPGSKGSFQVLYNHAPIVSTLDIGVTKLVDVSDKVKIFATSNGFTEIHQNKISILVDSADDSSEINIEKTEKELENLKEEQKNNKNDEEIKLQIKIIENRIRTYERFNES